MVQALQKSKFVLSLAGERARMGALAGWVRLHATRQTHLGFEESALLVVLTVAQLLHGEAGPMTSAFQPEQPARLPQIDLIEEMRWEKQSAVSGQTHPTSPSLRLPRLKTY